LLTREGGEWYLISKASVFLARGGILEDIMFLGFVKLTLHWDGVHVLFILKDRGVENFGVF
jgi:hypothetical protein